MNTYIILFCLLFLLLLLTFKPKFNRHKRNIKKANHILIKLELLEHNGQKINYLRKINPFVFEELLLTVFEKKGYSIKRNKRYTGDGGVDGTIYDQSKNKYLIQAKRYSGYVQLQHIYDFQNLVESKKCHKGFFIHTGKTGQETYSLFRSSNIEIISGEKLLRLIDTTIDQRG